MSDTTKQTQDVFKQCTMCGYCWKTQKEFLSDPDIEMVGYQVNFTHLSAGYLLFTHSCGTTFAVAVQSFENLYEGEIFESKATGSAECPGYCQHQDQFEPCPVACECAYVREIMGTIVRWPRRYSHSPVLPVDD